MLMLYACNALGLHVHTEAVQKKVYNGAGSTGMQQKERLIPAESMEAVRGRAMWELSKLIRPGSGAERGETPPIMLITDFDLSHCLDCVSGLTLGLRSAWQAWTFNVPMRAWS